MARRKKKTKAIEQQITPTTIGYSGKINVNVTNRGKKVYSGTFHNIGGTKLFQFICQCLAGQYSSAESNRPV